MSVSLLRPHPLRLLAIGGLLALVSCGGVEDPDRADPVAAEVAPEETTAGRGREERLVRDREELARLVRDVDAAGGSGAVLTAVRNALATNDPAQKWCRFDGWGTRRRFLESYLAWNEPLGEDVAYRSLDHAAPGHAFGLVVAYARALEEHGVDFLVVPVPTRLHVYPDLLPGVPMRDDFAGEGPGDVRFLLALADAGVEVLDLWTPYAAARYDESGETDRLLLHDDDVHWTPRGARLAADVLAARLREMAWFEPGDHVEGVDFQVVREWKEWSHTPGTGKIDVHFERVLGKDGKPARFADGDSPILVLGDSFVLYGEREGASLLHLLHARTGHRFDPIAPRGGRGIEWVSLARRGAELKRKRLVVWVVSASLFADHRLEDVRLFQD